MDAIFKKLADRIHNDYQETRSLPGERVLAERYVCARSTIRAALKTLQEKNLLHSNPRQGHKLIAVGTAQSKRKKKKQWNIALLASSRKMQDQHFLDFIGGAIHAARQVSVNLTVRELVDQVDLLGVTHLEQLHPGVVVDGYILTAFGDQLSPILEGLFKPCVVFGESSDLERLERRRFVQVYLPYREKLEFLLNRLEALNHRRVLLVVDDSLEAEKPFPRHFNEMNIDICAVTPHYESSKPRWENADRVLAALADHTALMIGFGCADALAIYRRVLDAGYEIPHRLSVTIDSGRFDYFIPEYGIATVYSSARDEGVSCMEELARQLESGSVDFMIRKSPFVYRDGSSLGQAMTELERAKYDQERNLPRLMAHEPV